MEEFANITGNVFLTGLLRLAPHGSHGPRRGLVFLKFDYILHDRPAPWTPNEELGRGSSSDTAAHVESDYHTGNKNVLDSVNVLNAGRLG